MPQPLGKFIFIDRDDTLIIDRGYLKDPAGIEFCPHALDGFRLLRQHGYEVVLITNQSGIGRGYFTEKELTAVHKRLETLLAAEGLSLAAIYYCPHAPSDGCHCRKPETGMLEAACRDFHVDRHHSAMIGDGRVDVLLGKNFGITSIQVTNGRKEPLPEADYVASDMLQAAEWLIRQQES